MISTSFKIWWYLQIKAIFFAIANKSAVLAGIDVVVEMEQESLAVLERGGIGSLQLPNGVDQLRENRSRFFTVALQIAATIRELVTEREPILLDEDLNSLQRSIVRIDQDLGDRAHLSSAIPSCTTNQNNQINQINQIN